MKVNTSPTISYLQFTPRDTAQLRQSSAEGKSLRRGTDSCNVRTGHLGHHLVITGCWGLVGGSVALVLHVGDEAAAMCVVEGDNLGAAVGKQHPVRPGDPLAIALLFVSEVVAGILVLDGVVELVGRRLMAASPGGGARRGHQATRHQ